MLKQSPRCLLATLLVSTFLVVSSLAIFCAYHHGIDGLDHGQQGDSHGTLFCPLLSKISTQTVIVSAAFGILPLELLSSGPVKLSDTDSLLLEKSDVARSPPLYFSFV